MDEITKFKHKIIICTVLFDRKNSFNKIHYYWISIILSGVFDII